MSDEADRRRAYRELEERGQPVPGKYFGKRMPPMKQKETPKVKVIDTTKMVQLKLLKPGGVVNPAKDPLKGIAKVIQTVGSGKTGIKTVDRQKKKDAILTKNLKRMAKTSKVKSKPQKFDITPKSNSAFSIQKETITMAKDGGLMEAINKVKKEDAVKMEAGGDPTKQLVGGQKKLDKNKDGRISGEDFKLLRAEPMKLGGVVKMGAGGGVCKGMGIARAGGKFKLR